MGRRGHHEHARDAEQHQSAHGRPGSKGDITKMQNETQVLSRTVSEKSEVPEGRVFQVESTNNWLQKASALKKENQALQDTMKLHEHKLKRTEKEQNNLQQYLHVSKVPK